MKTYTIITPANIEIEYRLAGAGSRLAAFIIDFVIQIIACLLIGILILYGLYGYRFTNLNNIEGYAFGFLIISWFLIYFCYFIVSEMGMNGQSIGKKIFGLRVICDNGQPVGFQQSVIRNLFKAVIDIVYIGLFFILFSPAHKRLGDIVAGTIVIAEHYDSVLQNTEILRKPTVHEDLKHLILNDTENNLLRSYITRRMYLPDHAKQRLTYCWSIYLSEKWAIDKSLINDDLLAGLLEINDSKY